MKVRALVDILSELTVVRQYVAQGSVKTVGKDRFVMIREEHVIEIVDMLDRARKDLEDLLPDAEIQRLKDE